MKLVLLTLLLFAGIAIAPGKSRSAEKVAPQIDVEIIWSEVSKKNQTDLFLLIGNPNTFDVYVEKCVHPTIDISHVDVTLHPIFGGCSITGLNDLILVGAKAHRLVTLWPDCPLGVGENQLKVHVSSWVDPKLKLPTNYVSIGNRDFSLSIANPDTLSR